MSTLQIGEYLPNNLEVVNIQNGITPLRSLLHGVDKLIIVFLPYCFGDKHIVNTIDYLIKEIHEKINEFLLHDIRVVCITKDIPSTARHWQSSNNNTKIEVFSDPSLSVTKYLIGIFDISFYLLDTKNIELGEYLAPLPSVLAIGEDGVLLSKYIAQSPDDVNIKVEDIFRMVGVNTLK